MTKISVFQMKGIEIEVMYRNKQIAYIFKHNDKTYGKSVDVKSRSVVDISNATWLLLQNAIETIDLIKTNEL